MAQRSISCDISRGDFIRGALASLGFGAFCGRRIFAAPVGADFGTPNLIFGAISDTHLRTWGKPYLDSSYTDEAFRNALKYFKDNGVDAIVHCGDWCDRGFLNEMEFHAKGWNEILGEKSTIEKLFVLGNHDFFDCRGTDIDAPIMGDNLANGKWREFWGEDYSPVWHKKVKGYHFFGYSYNYGAGAGVAKQLANEHCLAVAQLIDAAADAGEIDSTKPFFTLTHVGPGNNSTPSADIGSEGFKRIAKYRNAIGFYGHGHYDLASWENFQWYGNTYFHVQIGGMKRAKLERSTAPYFAAGYGDGDASGYNADSPNMHGYLVKVYSDKMVLRRIDFERREKLTDHMPNGEVIEDHNCALLGPDWVVPFDDFDTDKSVHPCSILKLREIIGAPQFASGSALSATWNSEGSITLDIPLADGAVSVTGSYTAGAGAPDTREVSGTKVYGYRVEVTSDTGGKFLTSVYVRTGHCGIGSEALAINTALKNGVTSLVIRRSDLPKGNSYTIKVWPCSALGTVGNSIKIANVRRGTVSANGAALSLV